MIRRMALSLSISVFLILLLSNAQAASPFGGLDNPGPGDRIAGGFSIVGWALDDDGIERVELLIDGTLVFDMPFGSSRLDVTAAFPGFPDSDNPGYAAAFNSRLLSNGQHTITARIVSKNDETADLSADVVVENIPGPENPREISLDLSTGLTAIDMGENRVVGALSGNTLLDFSLTFNSGLNAFVPTGLIDRGPVSNSRIEATIGDWVFLHTLLFFDAYRIQTIQTVTVEGIGEVAAGVGEDSDGALIISVSTADLIADFPEFEYVILDEDSTINTFFLFNLEGNNPEVLFATQDKASGEINTSTNVAGFRTMFRDGVPLSFASASLEPMQSKEISSMVYDERDVVRRLRSVTDLLPVILPKSQSIMK